MDRSLFRRALIIGIAFFILALVGFYLIFSWENWRYSQIPVIYNGPYPNQNPFAGGDIFMTVFLATIVELSLLPILAGSAAALALPVRNIAKNDLYCYAGLAGAIPLAIVSIIFWLMFIAGLVRNMMLNGGLRVPDQIWLYLTGIGINLLIILAGAFAAGVSGVCIWKLRGGKVN